MKTMMHNSLDRESCLGPHAEAVRESILAPAKRWRAFTFIEMLVSVAIISILVTISALGFRRLAESNVLAQAKNAVLTYSKIARSYAIANHVETMLVVNPFNGRFEIWHANPPAIGGSFSLLSDGTAPPLSDGYAYAPVLDSGARLPTDSRGRPLAAVHPIDYAEVPVTRPLMADAGERNMDNLSWAAFCFDKNGELVIRTRRIATRTYARRDASLRPAPANPQTPGQRNRLIDETPDMAYFIATPPIPMVVNGPDGDTPITSARGFIISDAIKMWQALGTTSISDPSIIVNGWLLQTRPGQPFRGFADTVVLNRYSGHELATGGV
jgi:prepilin-type N-terminal cleavage/methylation domain-containing protein